MTVAELQQRLGDTSVLEIVSLVPASEELDRTCAEKGLA